MLSSVACPSKVQKTGSRFPCGKGVRVGSGRQARLMEHRLATWQVASDSRRRSEESKEIAFQSVDSNCVFVLGASFVRDS